MIHKKYTLLSDAIQDKNLCSILYVEDNVPCLNMVGTRLLTNGYGSFMGASSIEESFDLLEDPEIVESLDVLILDLRFLQHQSREISEWIHHKDNPKKSRFFIDLERYISEMHSNVRTIGFKLVSLLSKLHPDFFKRIHVILHSADIQNEQISREQAIHQGFYYVSKENTKELYPIIDRIEGEIQRKKIPGEDQHVFDWIERTSYVKRETTAKDDKAIFYDFRDLPINESYYFPFKNLNYFKKSILCKASNDLFLNPQKFYIGLTKENGNCSVFKRDPITQEMIFFTEMSRHFVKKNELNQKKQKKNRYKKTH